MNSARPRRLARTAVAVGALLTLTAAGGCTLLTGDATGTGATATDDSSPTETDDESSATPRDEPSAPAIRSSGTAVPLGHSTVWVLVTTVDDGAADAPGPTVTVTEPGDEAASGGLVEVTVTDVPTTADQAGPAVWIAGPEGTAPGWLLDGSLVFRDSVGSAVAGADAPVGRVAGGSTAYYEPRADHAAVVMPPAIATASGSGTASNDETTSGSVASALTLTLRLSASAIVSATWGENEGGRSLAVVPTDWLRTGSLAAQEVGWSQLVAHDAEVDTSTMRKQYDCHALGARDKASWNLEPWRPDVGVFEVLAARCNPT